MNRNALILIVSFAVLLYSFSIKETATWSLDKAHAKLGFSITHLMVSEVEGRFKDFDAKITTSKTDFTDATVELTAVVNSINTDNEQRDGHLKSADFFDAEKYPVVTFKSKTFKKVDDQTYKVAGDLTMHGVTKTVELNVICKTATNPMSNKQVAGFKISGMVNRSDFGIGSSMSAAMVGDEVTISANAEFIKD